VARSLAWLGSGAGGDDMTARPGRGCIASAPSGPRAYTHRPKLQLVKFKHIVNMLKFYPN
jgi:hypothetical protein